MLQLIILVSSFALNVVSEAAILFWMKWGTFARSLQASLVMNFASATLSAVCLSVLFAILLNDIVSYLYGQEVWGIRTVLFFLTSIFVFLLTASVVIDTKILTLMGQQPMRKTWRVAIIANSISCLLVILLYVATSTVLSSS